MTHTGIPWHYTHIKQLYANTMIEITLEQYSRYTGGRSTNRDTMLNLVDFVDVWGPSKILAICEEVAPHIAAQFALECAERAVASVKGPYREELSDILDEIKKRPPSHREISDTNCRRGAQYAEECGLHAAWAVACLDAPNGAKDVAMWTRKAKGDWLADTDKFEAELKWQLGRLTEMLS